MRTSLVIPSILAAALVMSPASASAQQSGMAHDHMMAPSVMADLIRDVRTVKDKIVGLGEAIPEDRYGWRPGEGVRSVSEVLTHVAADNYFLPTASGTAAPASTGIQSGDYATVRAFEERQVTREEAIAQVRASFDHVIAAMEAVPPEDVGKEIQLFGRPTTVQALWITVTTHVHEHLGQLIAYARTNGVVPPWSR